MLNTDQRHADWILRFGAQITATLTEINMHKALNLNRSLNLFYRHKPYQPPGHYQIQHFADKELAWVALRQALVGTLNEDKPVVGVASTVRLYRRVLLTADYIEFAFRPQDNWWDVRYDIVALHSQRDLVNSRHDYPLAIIQDVDITSLALYPLLLTATEKFITALAEGGEALASTARCVQNEAVHQGVTIQPE